MASSGTTSSGIVSSGAGSIAPTSMSTSQSMSWDMWLLIRKILNKGPARLWVFLDGGWSGLNPKLACGPSEAFVFGGGGGLESVDGGSHSP